MRIWVNTLVRNEERYLWYAVMSAVRYVDKILIWDTGSSDKTPQIIKELNRSFPEKIDFKNFGEVTAEQFPIVRQKMLDATDSDWVLILDGDEVWWEESIKTLKEVIEKEGKYLESIVSRYYTVVGDIYHHQHESAGMYEIDKDRGHLNIKAMNRHIPGLHAARPHGQQGYFDAKGKLIQGRSYKKRFHIKNPAYLHFTNVQRSPLDTKVIKRSMKLKYEIGQSFPLDFYYPEVFFRERPKIVDSPWTRMSEEFYFRALIQTPFRKLKRKFIRSKKTGY